MLLQNKLLIKKVTLAISVVLLVFGVVILVQTYILKTSLDISVVQEAAPQNAQIVIRRADTGTEKARKQASAARTKFRLPPGSYTITVVGEYGETLGFTTLKRFKSSQQTLSLEREKLVQKIASGSLGCDEIIRNQLFSYACTRQSSVVRHDNPPDKFVLPEPLNSGYKQQVNTRPYLNGLLARFDDHSTRYIDYLELATNTRVRLSVPENSPEEYTIITDSTTSDNPRFLLLDPGRQLVFAYQNIQDTTPRKISLPKHEPEAPSLAYSLSGNRLVIYAGLPDHSSDTNEEEKSHKLFKQSYLYILDLDQKSGEFEKYNLPSGFKANNISPIGPNHYLVHKLASLELYHLNGQRFELKYLLHSPGAVSVGRDNVLFTKDGALYGFNLSSNQSKRLFSSSRLKVSRVGYSKEGTASFNGFIEGDARHSLHTFILTSDKASSRRWEEFLPYNPGGGLPIIQMDYTGTLIKVQLSLKSFISDRRTGKISHDPAEFEAAKQLVLQRLRSDGINQATTSINFTF